MNEVKNSSGTAVGRPVVDWTPARWPSRSAIEGRYCRIEPLDSARHLDDLYEAFSDDADGHLWTYMPVGPFSSKTEFSDWLDSAATGDDPCFYALVDRSTGFAAGVAALMRIKPEIGVIEVGHITYASRMQRTAMATDAMYLLMANVFDELGYRRYEWKCDSLNAASCTAAERLGFRFEGIFRQATLYKGRNRDTAWYSILDREWPALKRAYRHWLDDGNFDDEGRQIRSLGQFITAERSTESEEPV